MGDMGYLDEEGFLFLTGRSAEVIIAGGVNIYPVEIDQEVLEHPAVYDVAAVGVPNEEWGEEIKAVEIGRASCRERVCQYVKISVVAVSLKKKKIKEDSNKRSKVN